MAAWISSKSQGYILLPFNIQDALIGCLFISLGIIAKPLYNRIIEFLKNKNIVLTMVILVPLTIAYYWIVNNLSYQWMNLGENVWFIKSLPSTLIGFIIVILVSLVIEKTCVLDEALGYYGFNSMLILIFHNLDIMIVRNWAMRDWAFVGSTIMGYAFCVYLVSRINRLIKIKISGNKNK